MGAYLYAYVSQSSCGLHISMPARILALYGWVLVLMHMYLDSLVGCTYVWLRGYLHCIHGGLHACMCVCCILNKCINHISEPRCSHSCQVTCFAEAGGQHVEGMARAVECLGIRACLARSTMDTGEGLPASWASETTDSCLKVSILFFRCMNHIMSQ